LSFVVIEVVLNELTIFNTVSQMQADDSHDDDEGELQRPIDTLNFGGKLSDNEIDVKSATPGPVTDYSKDSELREDDHNLQAGPMTEFQDDAVENAARPEVIEAEVTNFPEEHLVDSDAEVGSFDRSNESVRDEAPVAVDDIVKTDSDDDSQSDKGNQDAAKVTTGVVKAEDDDRATAGCDTSDVDPSTDDERETINDENSVRHSAVAQTAADDVTASASLIHHDDVEDDSEGEIHNLVNDSQTVVDESNTGDPAVDRNRTPVDDFATARDTQLDAQEKGWLPSADGETTAAAGAAVVHDAGRDVAETRELNDQHDSGTATTGDSEDFQRQAAVSSDVEPAADITHLSIPPPPEFGRTASEEEQFCSANEDELGNIICDVSQRAGDRATRTQTETNETDPRKKPSAGKQPRALDAVRGRVTRSEIFGSPSRVSTTSTSEFVAASRGRPPTRQCRSDSRSLSSES
jgi:hypothetical protein